MSGRSWTKRALSTLSVSAAVAATVMVPASAGQAAAQVVVPVDYCLGQCVDILPPGQNGNATFAELLSHTVTGARPAHSADQLGMYANLAGGYQTLTTDTITQFFNDNSFGVAADDVERTYQPRSDVTVVRDKKAGVPHIYGTTRAGTMFGAGYATAENKLFLMDVLRRAGRGQVTPFAGGAPGNRTLEQGFFAASPYTEQELTAQIESVRSQGTRGAQAYADVQAYVDGINAYARQAHSGRYFPGEYVATGKIDAVTNAGTIEPFTLNDIVVLASLVGAQFGGGGGNEVQQAVAKLALQERYGLAEGERRWQEFLSQNDPEAISTVHDGRSFPYAGSPANPQGLALPDKGSVTTQAMVFDQTGTAVTGQEQQTTSVAATSSTEGLRGMLDGGLPAGMFQARGMSNALVVSGAHTSSGHPVAVFGPQTGYFAPQLLTLQELQGPGISSKGASFAGLSFYTLLGRGQDYAWSATTAGQDIIDTYAVELCEPSGATPTKSSAYYRFRGECVPFDVVERKNAWVPTLADGTAAGSYTLRSYRTKYGPVTHRATVGGKPVAYTTVRSTFLHEADSIIGFQKFNDPDAIRSAQDFQQAAMDVNYTFNWFYADSRDIAYINSGDNPIRKSTMDPALPAWSAVANEWQDWNPSGNTAAYTPFAQHPNSVNQDYYISWNNKQAPGMSGSPEKSSVQRGDLLDARVRGLIANGGKVTRVNLTQAMADAAITDLRAERILSNLLRVLDGDAATATQAAKLRAWLAAGGKRTETTPGSHVYAHAEAIALFDAWWPRLVKAIYEPGVGADAYRARTGVLRINESPSGWQLGEPGLNTGHPHSGSAFQYGWFGQVSQDIRVVLGETPAGKTTPALCGSLTACRKTLSDTLLGAAAEPLATTYPGDEGNCAAGDQWCADSIVQQKIGGIGHDKISWQNRPTYQQVVEFPARRGEDVTNLALGRTATATGTQSGHPASHAVDADPTTRWASEWRDNDSITVDLGATRQVARVRLDWEAAFGTAYRIETSTNGSTWRQAYTTSTGNGGIDNVTFTAADARYVRMVGVKRGTSYGYSLYDFAVYSR
jgi:acyl-homoserine lactone acylase PvdQ